MVNHKSAKKMTRVIERRTLINKIRKNKARTAIKKLMNIISSNNKEEVIVAFRNAESRLHKCVNQGVIHKNTAARKISRLNAKVKALVTGC
jgi:small subunit ribosomal protein S20